MEREIPVVGSFYRHFKGNIYQVKSIATHSESGETMVVYQAMYPPFGVWVRPLNMFLEPVDLEKYPEVTQKYRFEEYIPEKMTTDLPVVTHSTEQDADNAKIETTSLPVSEDELKQAILSRNAGMKLQGRLSDSEIGQQGMLLLLDVQTKHEKRELLIGLHDYLDDRMLNSIAVALDIALDEGSSEDHFERILHCLETFERYEISRLRS